MNFALSTSAGAVATAAFERVTGFKLIGCTIIR